MQARGAGEDASRARGIDFGYRGSGCRGGSSRKEGSGESESDTEVLSQCESHNHIGVLPQEGRRFQRVAGHLTGSKRAIGSGSGRELTPRVVGCVAPERRQGSVHSRLVRAEQPVDCQCRISHQAAAGTAALSSKDITLCRDCVISNWKSTLSPGSDHCRVTFDAFVGASLDVIAPSKPSRAPYAWNKARWNEFRKLSEEFIFRRMKRSVKGADALNEALTRGIRMAAKRTIPKSKVVAPLFWTPELTKLDKMVQECRNGSGMR
ncbi:hypothetical protein ERJ75_001473000 [Trypanosoma vivax]|nr:hypothetical protein ERJ75_001473000 [Trypanosoma vivax]